MTAKTENAHVLLSLPSRPVSQIKFYRLMVPFRVDGHIFRSKDVSLERLHYQLSTNVGLLQANLTYMHSKFWYGLSLDSRIIQTLEAASV